MMTLRLSASVAALLLTLPVQAKPAPLPAIAALRPVLSLAERVAEVLVAAPAGTRFGLLVTTADGREVLAIDPDGRFMPASNTKLFTTAAAYALLDMAAPDVAGAAGVILEPRRRGDPDVVLIGRGDAALSSAPDCTTDCLATLADAIAAKARKVTDVIGDDRWFPDERWSPGMSWNNIVTDSGTAISALSVSDNVVPLVVTPGTVGQPPQVALSPYFKLENQAVTIAAGKTTLAYDRAMGGDTVRLYGQIAAAGTRWSELLGIDDSAHFAAWNLRQMLEARGVRVNGTVRVRHRPRTTLDDPAQRGTQAVAPVAGPDWMARLTAPPLAEDVVTINKVSQNLHADLLLRRLGRIAGTGSITDGTAALGQVLAGAGLPRTGYDFSDGSGMSSYNRVSPRAAVTLLRWASAQPWGAAWRASLPIGGVDGTLRRRFIDSPLKGNLWAKTGTLNATNALSGYFRAASGRELVFAFFANDVPEDRGATATMDAALNLIAAAN
ncbi:MAG TPA: D-alanyl-D-alanine carboxypeptidase/D-alanyl-D-alanine-endopeptidase [Novosphingobium sp.]|nr:D-alanyl-D-alanine carboxypeptidase/D-alanyl-D-alanine-endopeptidase [Novosphingobium sp.]